MTRYALRPLRYALCLLFLACGVSRVTVRPTRESTRFRLPAPADTLKAWQLAANGDFERAETRLADAPEPLAQGLVDVYHGRLALAETEFRAVLDGGADSAMKVHAYVGLEALFMSHERYASLESLELRAAREHLEYDSTNRFVAGALNRLGRMEIEAATTVTHMPMKLSSVGVPTIMAAANGRREQDFWLDTGASMNVVTESFARRNGIRIISEKTGQAGTSTRRKVAFRMGVIDSLRLAGLVLRNVPVVVMRDQDLTFRLLFITLLKIDAIIGWPVISRFVTTLDYPQQELTLEYRPPLYDVLRLDDPLASPNLFFAGQPYTQVAIDSSGPLNFILDTGASTSMITPAGLDKLIAMPAQAGGMGCIGGAGGGDAGKIRTLRPLRFTVGGQELYPQTLMVHEFPSDGLAIAPDGILGEDVLRNFKVIVNAADGMLTLERD